MSDEQLRAGMKALRIGKKREARRILGDLVHEEPDNVAAWWHLATALDNPEQKAHCLRQVLRLRPDHAEARQMLADLERRVARPTPPDGVKRPVVEAQDEGGKLVVPDLTEAEASEGVSRASKMGSRATGVVVAAIMVLVALLGVVLLFWLWMGSGWFGSGRPVSSPTLRSLVFDVQNCAATGNVKTTLVFINNTGFAIEVLRGQPGQETSLLILQPGEQGMVDVQPGAQVRYAARTDAPGVTGSGAIIEVPQGSTCRVPIH